MQFFDIVSMSSEMGYIVTNVTVRTGRQKKHIIVVKCERILTFSNYQSKDFQIYNLK